jgi:gliding motility-associated-like protein
VQFNRIIIVILFFFVSLLNAQTVSDPCARVLVGTGQDSLIWSATPCANFDGFIIYASPDGVSAPVPVDTIFDPLARGYRNANATETARNYRVAIICGSVVVSISSIVSNQRPITPDLRSVSIIGGSPVLSWNPSPSPEVIGYQVYKENPYGSGNYFPYPANNQIVNGLSFTDPNNSTLLVRYAIVAVSSCNAGLLGEGNPLDGTTGPHSSILLQTSIDSCSGSITLRWNDYENWRDGVDYYIVRMIRNGGNPQNLDSVSTGTYIYPAAQNGDALQFWIEARERNDSNNAISNRVLMNVDVNKKMDFLYLNAVSIDATQQKPIISWRWDTDSDFGSAFLQRSTDSINWQNAQVITNNLSQINSIIDNSADSDNQRYFYRINFTDACGGNVISNKGANILLIAKVKESFVNELSWTDFYLDMAVEDIYDLHKIIGTNDVRLISMPETESVYSDQTNVSNPAEAISCYYIEARGIVNLPGNPPRYIFSRSNLVCPEQKAVLWFPNAFVPEGKNNEFKPMAGFGSTLDDYSLQIYDRYGSRIFESSEIDRGWDGTVANKALPQGVYIYVARYRQSDGTSGEQKGTVLLIR